MRNPFFSIIIPTYNQAHFLQQALKSVFSQTFKNFEVVVIDNQSSDNTKNVVSLFKKVIYKKIDNRGIIAKSRNYGMKIAKGKWIVFLDSDDYWKKDKLLYIFEKIKKNTFDVICHNEWIIDTSENNKKIEKKLWSYGPYEKDFYKKKLIWGNRNSTSASAVKKSFIKENNIKFDENRSFITSEDYCFFLNIARLGGIFYYISKPLGYHTMHKKSASANIKAHKKSKLAVIKHHIFKMQKFENKKYQLYKQIKKRINIVEAILNLKNNFFKKKYQKKFIKFLIFDCWITIQHIFLFSLKFFKRVLLRYLYIK